MPTLIDISVFMQVLDSAISQYFVTVKLSSIGLMISRTDQALLNTRGRL